ncbi:hypothetical protein G7054_g11677 [Neopestalotiopsis clavispora]|nr:hypothetical protein G7054_g11677 [Neopestalotiopsis clavispora]
MTVKSNAWPTLVETASHSAPSDLEIESPDNVAPALHTGPVVDLFVIGSFPAGSCAAEETASSFRVHQDLTRAQNDHSGVCRPHSKAGRSPRQGHHAHPALSPEAVPCSPAKLRSAPGSHIVGFLLIHELTAIVPLFGLAAAFHYYDIVPAGYVFGPWAPYVQDGAFKMLRYFRRKNFFGMGEEDAREGEQRFEDDLNREAEREGKGQAKGGVWALWGRIRGQNQKTDETSVEEVAEEAKSKTRRAVELAREKVTLRNTEAGYKIGVQLVAAYAIVKILLIPRIAFSLWVTPSFVRSVAWARRSLFKRA